jgi:methylenetetrahydrofolate dehydrogenase (NADP+)/methenyltetrahydrofolate cyclohydrolase
LGCLLLLQDRLGDLVGLKAVVVGRSNIVGKPMAQLLLNAHCTVTTVHSRSRNLVEECRQADILVVAVGRPGMIGAEHIKPGATVLDVGINRIEDAQGQARLVGDVDFAAASTVAGALTPVPGGIGPMTVACLLRNTLTAAQQRQALGR